MSLRNSSQQYDPNILDLYKIAIEEYRFEVRLNWDRTRYYLAFNAAIVGVGAGLLRLGTELAASVFVAFVFAMGIISAWLGVQSIKRGHQYFLRTVIHKTLLEHYLGLLEKRQTTLGHEHNWSLATTFDMAEVNEILHSPDKWFRKNISPKHSITRYMSILLMLIAMIDAVGMVFAISQGIESVASIGVSQGTGGVDQTARSVQRATVRPRN